MARRKDEYHSPYLNARLGKLPPTARTRSCIRCNKKFLSLSPGNRICPDCNKNTDTIKSTTKFYKINTKPISNNDS